MRYSEGSILQFTPQTDVWVVDFNAGEETWTADVIGWAVVAHWVNWDSFPDQPDEIQTSVEPVLFDEDEDAALLLREYLDNRVKGVTHKLRRV